MIDETDHKILNILQGHARVPNAQIAAELGMAPSAILERIRKLEAAGVIQGFETRINPRALDLGLVAFIFVRADEPIGSLKTGKLLANIPEVQEVHNIVGEDCYLLKVHVADTEALGRLLRDRFGKIKGIKSTRTTIALSTLKETMQLPLENFSEGEND